MYAANRALSYVDPMMKYKELAEGIDFYDFVKNLDVRFEEQKETLMENLFHAAQCIFRKENLIVGLTESSGLTICWAAISLILGSRLYEYALCEGGAADGDAKGQRRIPHFQQGTVCGHRRTF